ncbi:MAG: S-layer homology domain-containing protein [Elainellaceae cyanobacterium]
MMRTSTAVFCTLASLTTRELLLQARAVAVPDLDGWDTADQTTPVTSHSPEPPPTVLVIDPSPWPAAAGLPVVDFAHAPMRAAVQPGEPGVTSDPSPQPDFNRAAMEWAANRQPAVTQVPSPTNEPPATVSFPDVQGHWAQAFIEPLAVRGIVQGFPDGSFRPDAPLTRAQFAAMVRSAYRQPLVRSGQPFVDIPNNYWAAEAIAAAYQMGFVDGYPQRQFNPEQAITRAEALTALAEGLGAIAPRLEVANLDEIYQDAAQIPVFARQSVVEATANQWVVNFPNVNRLRPAQPSTRAEAAAFIHQSLVDQGVLLPVAASNPLRDYIVTVEVPTLVPPATPPEEVAPPDDGLPEEVPLETDPDVLRERYRLPDPAPIFEAIAPAVSRASAATDSGLNTESPVPTELPIQSEADPETDQEDWFSSVSFGGWGWLHGC